MKLYLEKIDNRMKYIHLTFLACVYICVSVYIIFKKERKKERKNVRGDLCCFCCNLNRKNKSKKERKKE